MILNWLLAIPGWIYLPEWFVYILLAVGFLLGAAPLAVILLRAPKQARTFIKAWLKKRNTIIVAREDHTLDIVAPEITPTGHQKVSDNEIYNPLVSDNPIVTTSYFWNRTGIPVMVADARKAIYTSKETLLAIAVVERIAKGLVVPNAVKKWAEGVKVKLTKRAYVLDDKTKQPVGIKETHKYYNLLKLAPAKLKEYFENAIDQEAQTVLYDMAVKEGMEKAGKQYFKMGIFLLGAAMFIISIVALLSVVA